MTTTDERWKKLISHEAVQGFTGELLGTFILVFFGIGSVAVTVLFSAHSGLLQVALMWGIGVSLAIYCTRHLSCAHLNPAVSLAMVAAGRMPLRKLPYYWLAQVLGAFAAGMLVYGIFSGSIASFELVHNITRGTGASVKTAMMFGEYFPNPGAPADLASVSLPLAFLVETLGTSLLVITIFMLTEGCNVGRPSSEIVPILIGLTVTAIIGVLAPLTQAGLNPARDFGPRLFAYLAGWGRVAIPGPSGGFFTVYVLGPLTGGILSALLFSRVLEPVMERKSQTCACEEAPPIFGKAESLPGGIMSKGGNQPTPDSIKVLVFGTTPPCAGCLQAEREAQRAAQRFPAGQVVVEKHDAFSIIGKENQVSTTPTIIVAGRKVAVGKVLTEDQIAEIVTTQLRCNHAVSSA
jgi:glycerol uptake facilitator protein